MKNLRFWIMAGIGLVLLIWLSFSLMGNTVSEKELTLALTEVSAERTQEAEIVSEGQSEAVENQLETEISIPSATVTAVLFATDPRGDGIYLVGAQIAPGVWRSVSEGQGFCYWARRKYDGILFNSYYGLPGVEFRIYESDYEVELEGCGEWIYMGAR